MLRLRAFGTLYVADSDGAPLTGAAGQRRVLAFLSALVAAGHAGLSRDKLAALLWPEADTERARHSVTQALYAARRALKCEDLFDAGGDIRLNRARLSSDVDEFEAALTGGELERAVSLYAGPFLDGFFLPGSPEFEQWSSSRREHYEGLIVNALQQLASGAEQRRDYRSAAGWRKRLAGLRPLDSSAAIDLMTAFAQAGDRAGALRHGEIHALLLREELGIEPDAAVSRLIAKLRNPTEFSDATASVVPAEARSRIAGPTQGATAADGHPIGTAVNDEPGRDSSLVERPSDVERPTHDATPSAPAAVVAQDSVPPLRARTSWLEFAVSSRVWWVSGTAAVILLALLAVVTGRLGARHEAAAPRAPVEAPLRQTVVVAPFRVAGASEALGYLRDGLVELLSARLADESAARSVDAGAVLSAWSKAGFTRDVDLPRATVVRLAASLGAERVVIGSVVGSTSHAILSATALNVPTGEVAGTAAVEGPVDSVTMLVDRLAARLLVQVAGEDGALAEQTTRSLPALRSFLAGQAAFHRHDYDAAQRAYERALERDSSFALAALQLARSAERLQSAEHRGRPLALAWLGRSTLSERDLARLMAMTGPRFPAPSSAAELVAAWDRLARLSPDRADSWYELGARLFHDGALAGLSSSLARANTALRRAYGIDSTYAPVRSLIAQIAANTAELAVGERPSRQSLPLDSVIGPFAPFIRWRVALARRDEAALRRIRDTMPHLGRANLRSIAEAAQFDAVALADARRAVDILRSRAVRTVDRLEAVEASHALSLNEGRLRDAEAALRELADLQLGSRAPQRLRVMNALYGDGNRAAAAAAAALLEQTASVLGRDSLLLGDERALNACVLAQWKLANGDTAGVATTVRALGAVDHTPSMRLGDTPPRLCAELLDATLAVTLRQSNAPGVLARLDAKALTAVTSGDAISYAPLLIARLYEQLGNAAAALAAVRKRTYMTGWPRYLAVALREEGRYAAATGDAVSAREAYARHLILRAAPDSMLVAARDSVRMALAALPFR